APTTPHWETWISTSVDGHNYDSPATPLAHTYSSLDLMVWQDHVLIVSGSTEYNPDLGLDAPWESIFVLYSLDLKTWGSGIWPIEDAEFELLTDPALHVADDGGVQVVYYSRSGDSAITPPDLVPGDHDIKMADRSGDTFVERSDRIYADEYLVDPVYCSWDGVNHLFATRDGHVTHAVQIDGQFVTDESFEWDQQVPFCFDQDGQHKVIAQAGGGVGEPTVRTLQDDGSFSEPEPFFDGDDPFDGHCTSPVVGFFQDRWVMLCAVWVG
ncbi:MAG: hypothetical protein GXP62_05810, partial [Oligoflexia bacterium]|nr:hypothetical protein [Oligoflexia bacterium]